jgi:UTP--glucose-1-phosphate uridylyltransferase
MSERGLREAEQRMRERGEADDAIRAFARAYQRYDAGESATISSDELEPAGDVVALGDLPEPDAADALGRLVQIKLNGGLATTMGLRSPKSLVEARDGRSFLEIIAGQTLALRARHGVRLPLLLMDSEATEEATRAALAREPALAVPGLPADFLQSMIPKIDAETGDPVRWPAAPALEWCPPGHGDIYGALRRSGALRALLDGGFTHAIVSNADNLGATADPRIAAHVAERGIPFLMEVVEGTEADRKGGHIARRRADGRIVLRETAQTPAGEEDSFRDFRRWRYYNTNNLWVDLRVLEQALAAADGVIELPLIVNRKTVDPRDPSSPAVVQLESAMGAAIASFDGAEVVVVPRSRFVPVKTTDDLLVLRSDVYELTGDMEVRAVAALPYVELDPRHYRLLDEFERRFPSGLPSLRAARRFVVRGDVTFGAGVVVRGSVELDGPATVPDGAVLEGQAAAETEPPR